MHETESKRRVKLLQLQVHTYSPGVDGNKGVWSRVDIGVRLYGLGLRISEAWSLQVHIRSPGVEGDEGAASTQLLHHL